MTLLELLRQELPKRGGWPEGAVECCRHRGTNSIDFYDDTGNWPEDCYLKYGKDFAKEVVYENDYSLLQSVTRKQYESALAAAQQPVWNGEGLPPVGTECEYSLNAGRTWFKCKIDYILGTQGLIMLADVYEGGQFVSFAEYDGKLKFRPILSEAERKRDAFCNDVRPYLTKSVEFVGYNAGELYDAIAAGKIAGVRLTD